MSMSLHGWRIAVLALMLSSLLVACGSAPTSTPSRASYPDGSKTEDDSDDALGEWADDAGPFDTSEMLPDVDEALFAAVRDALRAGDWLAASLALPRPSAPATQESSAVMTAEITPTTLWARYYEARIALLRGDLEEHKSMLRDLRSTPLPPALRQELLEHRLNLALLAEDTRSQVLLSHQLLRSDSGEGAQENYQSALWQAVQRLDPQQRDSLSSRRDPELRAWLALASANAPADPEAAAGTLSLWLDEYPEHPAAERAQQLLEAARRDAATAQLTLLVPLSGPLEKAGDAVSRGFLAAYYEQTQSPLRIDIVDSRRFDNVAAAYQAATERGADVVVGPLAKRQVESLLEAPTLTTPVLTLNRPEIALRTDNPALQLSLAPEDEARQLAERAFSDGVRRTLLIRPEGIWGDRMENALLERWRELGGSVRSRAVYGDASTHSDAIRSALNLDESDERSRAIRSLFTTRVETSGRRRQDLDGVFLLSKSAEEAMALKPMINYHYAGDLGVYALSTADSGGSADRNRDLGDVRLLAMPWRLTDGGLPGLDESEGQSSGAALHALGADAFAIARRWWRMASDTQPVFVGLTADLHTTAGDNGVLLRRLKTAEFDSGRLTPR